MKDKVYVKEREEAVSEKETEISFKITKDEMQSIESFMAYI